jgi:hypothetical protein
VHTSVVAGVNKMEPDFKRCRTFDIGIAGYAECLCSGPNMCRHAVPFGYTFLCHHPRLAQRIRREESPLSSSRRA